MHNRILIVDGCVAASHAIAGFLSVIGYRVAVAPDVRRGLKLATTFRPHVVMVDFGLPDVEGCRVAARMRARPELAVRGLFAMGADLAGDAVARARAAGFDRYFLKPLSLDALLLALQSIARAAI